MNDENQLGQPYFLDLSQKVSLLKRVQKQKIILC